MGPRDPCQESPREGLECMRGVFVFGTIRSGTTVLIQAINKLGFKVTTNYGAWENNHLNQLANKVRSMQTGECLEDDPSCCIYKLMEEINSHKVPWAMKSPLGQYALPVLLPLLEAQDQEIRLVVTRRRREPCIASSLKHFTPYTPSERAAQSYDRAVAFWNEISKYLKVPHITIDFDELIDRPVETIETLNDFLWGLSDNPAEAAKLVNPKERHHV